MIGYYNGAVMGPSFWRLVFRRVLLPMRKRLDPSYLYSINYPGKDREFRASRRSVIVFRRMESQGYTPTLDYIVHDDGTISSGISFRDENGMIVNAIEFVRSDNVPYEFASHNSYDARECCPNLEVAIMAARTIRMRSAA